jgi:hypothetical protein
MKDFACRVRLALLQMTKARNPAEELEETLMMEKCTDWV